LPAGVIICAMPGVLVRHPPTTRRWRWYGHLSDDQLGAVGFLGAAAVGVGTDLLTGLVGAAMCAALGFLALDLAGRRIARRILRGNHEHQRWVTDDAGAAELAAAREAVRRIEKAWPHLGVLDDERPSLVLAGSLWDLAGDLLRRAELRDASAAAEQLLEDLTGRDEPARAALVQRMAGLAAAEQRVDAAVSGRVETLGRLADACERQVIAQGTRVRLEELTRRTDSLLAADQGAPGLPEVRDDPAAELAERTEAVLAAYRELRDGTA
jgi:hypothetical protein